MFDYNEIMMKKNQARREARAWEAAADAMKKAFSLIEKAEQVEGERKKRNKLQ
jgi:hypothetical protein